MRFAIRCDASTVIGTGHLHRCLSLAEALVEIGSEVRFVLRRHDGVAERIMEGRPFPAIWLRQPDLCCTVPPERAGYAAWAGVGEADDSTETIEALREYDPHWIVVDHYAFGATWHSAARSGLSCRILAIDDLGDREMAADTLLDANACPDHAVKHQRSLKPFTRLLAGPRYALLAKDYVTAERCTPSDPVRSIGIFMGGADEHNASGAAFSILREELGFDGAIEIATTSTAPHCKTLAQAIADDENTTLSVDLPNLARFHARHDLQIGAGGTASYERACIGVPTIAVVLSENQLTTVPFLSQSGAVASAAIPGISATMLLPSAESLASVVSRLMARPVERLEMARVARSMVDGCGAQRVALSLLADTLALRPAMADDARMLFNWRNDPTTRAVSRDTAAIDYEHHVEWLAAVLASSTRHLFVAVVGTKPVGSIRFDWNDQNAWEISLYTDPAMHGLGLGSLMLEAGERAMLMKCADRTKIIFHAKVEPGNMASSRMFSVAGYTEGTDRLSKTRETED